MYLYQVYLQVLKKAFPPFLHRDNEEKDLSRLLDLLNTPASKQQVSALSLIFFSFQNKKKKNCKK